jgi:hypothetical protein
MPRKVTPQPSIGMNRKRQLIMLAVLTLSPAAYYFAQMEDRVTQASLLVSVLVSLFAFWACR